MKQFLTTAMILSLLITTSCAALFNGSRGKVQVNSSPAGAEIYVDGKYMGVTPKKIKLDNEVGHTLVLKSGTQQATYTLESKLGAGWVVLDVLGGLIPVVVDAATGSWHSLKPNKVDQTFKPEEQQIESQADNGSTTYTDYNYSAVINGEQVAQ